MTLRFNKTTNLVLLLIFTFVYIAKGLCFADGTPSIHFSDMSGHWGLPYVNALIKKQVIGGFPDGTFKPQGTVTVAEFSKILVSALGYKPQTVSDQGHWARGYMDVALKQGLVYSNEKEFQALNAPLTRGQLSRMLYRALPEPFAFKDLVYHQYMIKDFDLCQPDDRLPILNCFRLGIITGYPDSTFKDKLNVTRAEASAMMMRYLDESLRLVPTLPYAEGVTITESEEKDRYDFYIAFNLTESLEPQYVCIENYLNKKISVENTNKILQYARQKTNYRDELSLKKMLSGQYHVEVLSSKLNALIIIRGIKNE